MSISHNSISISTLDARRLTLERSFHHPTRHWNAATGWLDSSRIVTRELHRLIVCCLDRLSTNLPKDLAGSESQIQNFYPLLYFIRGISTTTILLGRTLSLPLLTKQYRGLLSHSHSLLTFPELLQPDQAITANTNLSEAGFLAKSPVTSSTGIHRLEADSNSNPKFRNPFPSCCRRAIKPTTILSFSTSTYSYSFNAVHTIEYRASGIALHRSIHIHLIVAGNMR